MKSNTKTERCVRILLHLMRNQGKTLTVSNVLAGLGLDESERQGAQRDLRLLAELSPETGVKASGLGKHRTYKIARGTRKSQGAPPLLKQEDFFAFLLMVRLQFSTLHGAAGQLGVFEDLLEEFTRFALHFTGGLNSYQNLRARFSELVIFAGELPAKGPSAHLAPQLYQALLEKRKLRVTYESGSDKKPKERTLEPWKMVVSEGELYFLCPTSAKPPALMTIKLTRILEAKLLPDRFAPDPAVLKRQEKLLMEGTGLLNNAGGPAKRIKVSMSWWYRHIMSERKLHPTQKTSLINSDDPNQENRSIEVTLQAPINEDVLRWIRKWGDAMVVEQPVELKERLLEYADYLYECYRSK